MLRIVATLLVLWIVLLAVAVDKSASQPVKNIPPLAGNTPNSTNLSMEIAALDRQLFDAVFQSCDLNMLKPLLASDFEFLHDKGGLVATNSAQFLDQIRASCHAKSIGKESRSRRELLSSEIFPLANYGAIQTGTHRFFIMEPGLPERSGDIAKFTHVWRRTSAGWQLTRVLSYDHKSEETLAE
jgi:hypothetical protein